MMKMNNNNGSPTRCLFSNYRSILILGYLKFWGYRKKNVGVQEEEASCYLSPQFILPKFSCSYYRPLFIMLLLPAPYHRTQLQGKNKNILKNGIHIKLYFELLFPEHNNLFGINFSGMYYFQFWIFFIRNEILIFCFRFFISGTQ